MDGISAEIEKRRARRALDERKVPEEAVKRIMTAATWAPSCGNNQSWRFILVQDKDVLGTVKEHLTGGNYWAKKSPLIILVVTEESLDCQLSDNRNYALYDTGLAVGNLMIQAVKEGLIAHPIAGFKPLPIKEALGIPGHYTLINLVVIGYPGDESGLSEKHLAQEHGERDRKPMDEVVMFDRWTLAVPEQEE